MSFMKTSQTVILDYIIATVLSIKYPFFGSKFPFGVDILYNPFIVRNHFCELPDLVNREKRVDSELGLGPAFPN